ncbi:MAG: ABC transporter ATP-binding protein, partial [Geitlerinemataceae cyanobacterium]
MPRNSIAAKLRQKAERLAYLPQTLSLVWQAAPTWTIAWLVLLVFQGFLPVATVYLTRLVVDNLSAAVGAGLAWENIQSLLVPAALMAGVLLLTQILQGANEWIRTAQAEFVQDHISALVHAKSIEVDFSFYESSEFFDRLDRARNGASGRSLALLQSSGSLLQNSITMLAMTAVLLAYGLWLPMVLLLSALPAFYVVMRLNRRHHRWWEKTTIDRRWLQYYELLITQSMPAAEVRLFGLGPYFRSAYQTLRRRLRTEHIQIVRDQSLGRLLAGIIALIISGGALAWMGRQVLLGRLTLGDVALFYQAFNKGQGLMKSLLSNVNQIYQNSLFISNLFEFLQIAPKIVDPPQPQPVPTKIDREIRFKNVTFRYPDTDRAVLQDYNLTLPAGKIVAIVGDNGAGKSTLIKLLCRFYDPESGSIEIDGTDIREFAVEDLRRLITVLFQSPIPFYVTAGQNIALGDLSETASEESIEAAAHGAGIHEKITSLPQGYKSMLGKWFPGGTDLSG